MANTSVMPDYSRHQKGIIQRYYDNREKIMLERLGTIVTELFLVESDKRREALWKRAKKAMDGLKVPPKLAEHILNGRDAEILARNVRDWERRPPEAN